MNAVVHFADLLAPEALRRLAALRVSRFEAAPAPRRDLDVDQARAQIVERWSADLCGALNALTRGELAYLAQRLGIGDEGRSHELRARLWDHGARLERGGAEVAPRASRHEGSLERGFDSQPFQIDHALQPRPIVLGGHLVVQAAPRGMYPSCETWPRPLPDAVARTQLEAEPETLDDLLAAADRAIGVRLGRRGLDKGAWGTRAAKLLGVIERGIVEPDWRGDVEIKTVPVAREPSGLWRIVEDPAIAMMTEGTVLAKLQRTLWLARADVPEGDATILSWYLLDWDPEVARLARRYLHTRPKGPAGTDQRGVYLHKRFFADAGLLATLNGP